MRQNNIDNRNLYEKVIALPSLLLLFVIFLLPLISTLSRAFIVDN